VTEARPAPRRQERGRRRIEQVLDVAAAVFADVGYEAATTNSIASAADMSPGSLYQFFPNKEAIAEALAARYVDGLQATHDVALVPDVATLSLDELIDRTVDPLLAFHLANPGAHALLAGADLSPRLAARTQQLHAAMLDRIEAIVAARSATLRPKERQRVALVSVQIFKGLQPLVLAATPRQRPALVRELKAALRGYLSALDSGTGVS
jgi:AcrR family transcriptional regulator